MSKETTMERWERKTETHPSYVTVQFNRVTGGGYRFFGSSVKCDHFVVLRVSKAKLRHDLGQDWVHGECESLIEVAMTPSQFAELLTTMNHGSGVPGTLQRYNGKQIDRVPESHKSEARRSYEDFKSEMEDRCKHFKESYDAVAAKLKNKKNVSQADRDEILDVLNSVVMQFISTMPFYLQQFEEAMGKSVVQAKAEVDAFISHAVQSTGLAALREKGPRLEIEDQGDEG